MQGILLSNGFRYQEPNLISSDTSQGAFLFESQNRLRQGANSARSVTASSDANNSTGIYGSGYLSSASDLTPDQLEEAMNDQEMVTAAAGQIKHVPGSPLGPNVSPRVPQSSKSMPSFRITSSVHA